MGRARPHLVRPAVSDRTPDLFCVIDTEARLSPDDPEGPQNFEVGCAHLVRRHGVESDGPRAETQVFYAPDTLARLLREWAPRHGVLDVYAHNLSVDLSITWLSVLLVRDGWKLGDNAIGADHPYAHLSRGKQSLWLKDSASWLPKSVEDLGREYGMPKLRMPEVGEDPGLLEEYCVRDAEIVARCLECCMDWLDQVHGGSWGRTGPGTGFNFLRRRHVQERGGLTAGIGRFAYSGEIQWGQGLATVFPPGYGREIARQAIYGGQREVQYQGELPAGWYGKLDLERAHLNVARHRRLPHREGPRFDHLEVDDPRLCEPNLGLIALCRVQTDTPRYPRRSVTGVLYPVGEFWTVLCGPEIVAARRRGELRDIGPGQWYGMSYHMADWAEELDSLLAVTSSVPAPVHTMLKHWSRAVIGKWAGWRSQQHDLPGPLGEERFELVPTTPDCDGRRREHLFHGLDWYLITHDIEPEWAIPAILAYVQSHTRLWLQEALEAVGESVWVSANTDGLLFPLVIEPAAGTVDQWPYCDRPEAERALADLAEMFSAATAPARLRAKGVHDRVHVWSAQQHLYGDVLEVSGVPKDATRTGPDTFTMTVFPKLRQQLRLAGGPGLVVEQREVHMGDVAVNRWRYRCGHCRPVRCVAWAGGATWIVAPGDDRCPLCGAYLAGRQWPELNVARHEGYWLIPVRGP